MVRCRARWATGPGDSYDEGSGPLDLGGPVLDKAEAVPGPSEGVIGGNGGPHDALHEGGIFPHYNTVGGSYPRIIGVGRV